MTTIEQNGEELHLRRQLNRLLFAVRKSVRYHCLRQKFFEGWHRFTSAVGVVFGSAAAASLLASTNSTVVAAGGSTNVAIGSAFIVAVMSAIDLVVGFARHARLYQDLAREFLELEKAIISVRRYELNEEQVLAFKARRLEIETKEPPTLVVLNALCHNEQLRSQGSKQAPVKIGPIQRALAQYVDLASYKLQAQQP